MSKSLRSELIRLAHTVPTLRPHLLPMLKKGGSLVLNPKIVPWGKQFSIKLITKRGETLWTGDGWKHSMDFRGDDGPSLFDSKPEAEKEITTKVLPYIARWQPGMWEDFVRGWEPPTGVTPR